MPNRSKDRHHTKCCPLIDNVRKVHARAVDFKVARYSFLGSIPPPEFEHKLRRHKDLENCHNGCIR